MTDPQHEQTFADTERKLREIITTLRAQLAEALAERDVWEIDAKRNHQAAEIEFARAEQAEAALAAQIEADAGIADSHDYGFMSMTDADMRAVTIAHAIRNQPHDRTALDRYREKVLREAAQACDWGDIYGGNAVRAILALIEKE